MRTNKTHRRALATAALDPQTNACSPIPIQTGRRCSVAAVRRRADGSTAPARVLDRRRRRCQGCAARLTSCPGARVRSRHHWHWQWQLGALGFCRIRARDFLSCLPPVRSRRERDGSLCMGDSDSDDYDGVAGEWSWAEGQSRAEAPPGVPERELCSTDMAMAMNDEWRNRKLKK